MITTATLAGVNYGQAEDWHHAGYISQDQWEAYQTAWRRSAPRMSSLAAGTDSPQTPVVEALVAEITANAPRPAVRLCKRCHEPATAHCPDCNVCTPSESEHPDWCGQE